ncbi:MAG TPA: hypothetical protein VKD25_08350 [Burkholderiales bacterium]|nr:hypothetical protein [Burkholderiales bacterium]
MEHVPTMKTFEIGVILLVHAKDLEEARRTLESCIPPDLRVEAKEVQYCEENLLRCVTLN